MGGRLLDACAYAVGKRAGRFYMPPQQSFMHAGFSTSGRESPTNRHLDRAQRVGVESRPCRQQAVYM